MSFSSLYAQHYDSFSGAEYTSYAAFFEKAAQRFAAIRIKEVLDLGCGTGELSALLSQSGLEVVGVDISNEMLTVARSKGKNHNVLLLNQDMRALDLYGTVQGAVSCYDCLNYLSVASELLTVFSLLHNYIEPGGIFVFDVNTPYRYSNVFADNSFCFEDDTAFLVWQNEYNASGGRNRMYLTLFSEMEDGRYFRYDDTSVQRSFALGTVSRAATEAGFTVCGTYGDTEFSPLQPESEKAYFVLRRE